MTLTRVSLLKRRWGVPLTLAAVGLLVSPAWADDFWREKPPAQWTQEEALAVLTDSPWAKEVTIWHATGRLLQAVSREERSYITGHGKPKLRSIVTRVQTEPERLAARYAVRWNSARIVQQAWERLRQVAPQVMVELHALPPELTPEHCVVTVRVVEPPRPPATHLFQGLPESELVERAKLQSDQKLAFKPVRVLRHGLGAGAALSFFFPRRPNLPPHTQWAEFVFNRARGETLKAKFKFRDMHAEGQP